MDDHVDELQSAKDFPDWAGISRDILSQIFLRAGTVCLFTSVQFVCRKWWMLAHDPQIWRRVVLKDPMISQDSDDSEYSNDEETSIYFPEWNMLNFGLAAVDRSAGCLEEFVVYGGQWWSGSLLKNIAQWCYQLKSLELRHCVGVYDKNLIEACKNFPLLKKFHLVHCTNVTEDGVVESCKSFPLLEDICYINYRCRLTADEIESIGQSCPELSALCFAAGHIDIITVQLFSDNDIALVIAKNMLGLRKLYLWCVPLDDDGLLAILDGCTHLECLYIRECHHLMFGENLKYRLSDIKVKYYSLLRNKYIDYKL